MKSTESVDYLAAIEQFRQEELSDQDQIHTSELTPVSADEPVDYLAAVKAWNAQQAGTDKIYLHARKRNASHDPENC